MQYMNLEHCHHHNLNWTKLTNYYNYTYQISNIMAKHINFYVTAFIKVNIYKYNGAVNFYN